MLTDSHYICFDCGEEFDTPKLYIETHGLDSPPYEKVRGCPVCGGAYDKFIFFEKLNESEGK